MPTDPERATTPLCRERGRVGPLKLAQLLLLMVGIGVLTAILGVVCGKTVLQAIQAASVALLVTQVGYAGSIGYFAYARRRKDRPHHTPPNKRRH